MEISIPVRDRHEALKVLGTHDRHLKVLRETFNVTLFTSADGIVVRGPQAQVRAAGRVIEAMLDRVHAGDRLEAEEVKDLIASCAMAAQGAEATAIEVLAHGMKVVPRTPGQRKYVRAIGKNHLVFCIGPAGTGKTYLAVAMAIHALKTRQVRRIILARPAVEAGERLGFLPGDLQAKVNPYLRPLYDALSDMMEFGQLRKYMDNDMIEVIPLAYMRGRTLNHAFIILDEAQNCTTGQMKMCLTRLGEDSRAIITGDITQTDLPPDETSGLVAVQGILQGLRGIEFVYLKVSDIVRHRLVQDIVNAYESFEQRRKSGAPPAAPTETP
jgi:phosphate starvation-inducible protein PhoH and related proteins